jgi:membrane protein DedA with SNARE-associated domain
VPEFDPSPFFYFFGMFVVAGLGAPVPEEIAIVWAGIWTATCDPSYGLYKWLMLPVCILGVLIADGLLYGIGWLYGTRLLEKRWMRRFVPPEKRMKIQDNFHRYGVNILVFGRLLPGIRSPLFLTAGTMRLSLGKFFLADGLGAVLGNSLLFFLAFWFGDQFRELVERVQNDVAAVRPLLILLAIGAVGIYFLVHFLRRPVTTGDPEEIPIIGAQVATRIDHSDSHPGGERAPKNEEGDKSSFNHDAQGSAPAPRSSETSG